MSIELCVLASGSSGNSAVVRTPGGVLLIDAGIGPRTTGRRMEGTGITVADVSAVCLTHLDRDHFNGNWVGTIAARGIRVFCHAGRLDELLRAAERDNPPAVVARFAELVFCFDDYDFEVLPGLTARPIALAHDREGSHGFVFEGYGCRIGYATDLGRVPQHLPQVFDDLDLLAIESNYDGQMQLDSPRPWFLKRRIMGGAGHLSNEQALEAVRAVFGRCERRSRRLPAHVVLLHRSRQCNCPQLLRRLFSRDARIAPRLVLAEQFERTEWLRAGSGEPIEEEQLSLAFG